MYFPSRTWVVIKKFLGCNRHPISIILKDLFKYIHEKYGYGRINYRTIFKIMFDSVKQTELCSYIQNTRQMFWIKIPEYITNYELALLRKRKYIEAIQIILSPRKDEHYYQEVIIPKQHALVRNKIFIWANKDYEDKYIVKKKIVNI